MSTIFTLPLPSEQITVKFRAPSFVDRRSILKDFQKDGGYTSEDLLAVKCLVSVNGTPYDANAFNVLDPVEILHHWPLNDYMYYLEVFLSMFMLDEKARENASNVAKKLLSGETIVPTEKKGPATLPTGKATA